MAEFEQSVKPNAERLFAEGRQGDYSLVRDAIEKTYPDIFCDFNARLWQPGGFPRPLPALERRWKTAPGHRCGTRLRYTPWPGASWAEGIWFM